MPSPDPSWTLVEVRWAGVAMDGGLLTGTIEALPSVSRFLVNGKLVIVNHQFSEPIISNTATLQLPASNDTDVNPTGWTWTITEKIDGRPDVSYVIEAPISAAGTGIDIAGYAPVSESVGLPVSLVTRIDIDAMNVVIGTKVGSADLADVAFSGSGTDITTGTLPKAVMPALADVAYSGSATDITTGTLPSSVLPPLSVGTGTSLVSSQAAMLALTGISQGHVAIRTDFSPAQEYYLTATPASTLGNWTQVNLAGISSINGITGSSVIIAKSDIGLGSVDNTSDAAKPLSTAATTALAGKEPTIPSGTNTQYLRGDKTFQTLNKTAVGLDQVDNTSDTTKVSSGPIATALSGKEATLTAGTTSQYYRGDKSWQTMNKTAVGLGNVDNTSDVNKPVSTAQAAATADMTKSKAGVGGFILIRDGIDTPTGDPKELVLVADPSGGVSGGTSYPPGLDVIGGQVGCTWADPGMMVIPTTSDTESNGNVIVATANTRISARFTMQDVVLNKVSWQIGDGSTAAVSGTIGIARPDGTILRQGTVNLTPATVTAVTGDTQTWTLSGATGSLTAPLTDTDLNVGDELVIFTQHSSGTVRFYARGFANMINPDTVYRTSGGSLHRSGALASAPTVASPLTFTTGYTKKPCPFFLFTRTI